MGVTRPRPERAQRGQMTIELALALPVAVAVAAIVVNALAFMADCAEFDRLAHQAVRVHAVSPAYGQGPAQSCALVQSDIQASIDATNVEASVTYAGAAGDLVTYTATLLYHPTLFGMGLRDEVMGVALPALTHTVEYTVDVYKPGVVI